MRKTYTLLILWLSFTVAFSSCTKEPVPGENISEPNIPVVIEEKVLVKAEHLGSFTRSEVNSRYDEPFISMVTQFDIEVYKITYRTTDFSGRKVLASGALLYPNTDISVPIVSLQHGTIRNDLHAPSYYNTVSEAYQFGSVMASAGYIVSAPDYLGYGVSNYMEHPYEHAATLGSASADMLRATKEFVNQKNIRHNRKLFLAGYSEGGYATMALHKTLEEKYPEIEVTASAPGGGAYNKTAFAEYILSSNSSFNFLNSYLWVLDTYNREHKLNRPVSAYLNEPYATRVKEQGAFAQVSTFPKQLFSNEFRKGILNGTDTEMLRVFAENDLHNWKPKAPVALFHGADDDYVPLFNSETAFDEMKKKGAIVDLYVIPGDHFSAVMFYAFGVFEYFSSFD